MNILIAVDAFKGSLSSMDLADCIEKGLTQVNTGVNCTKVCVADGGEGTVDALVRGTGGRTRKARATGPLGESLVAEYGIIHGGTAVIEMAAASGLPLVPEDQRNPLRTTSFGTGELIKSALNEGCRKIIMGIGGSATNDGGAGMAQALGISFKDGQGREICFGGGALKNICSVDASEMIPGMRDCEFLIASDVANPLCGPQGASAVYGPQKGATPEMIPKLDKDLERFGRLIEADCGRPIITIPGSGAAGGLAVPLLAYGKATLTAGIDIVFDTIGFEGYLDNIDLVITGEGRIDGQSVFGKVPVGVAGIAQKKGIPVIAVVGGEGEGVDAVYERGIDAIVPIPDAPMSLAESVRNTEGLVTKAAQRIGRLLNLQKK